MAEGKAGLPGHDGMNGRDGRDSRPVPDPTRLTSELVKEASDSLKEILESRISGQKEVFQTRLGAMDEAIKLLQTILDRTPAEVDVKIGNLERLHDERLKGIETRILERDDQKKEAKADAKVGIDAALASAEKLVGQSNDSFKELFEKAERSTEKLLDKQDENQKNSAGALEDKISGLKERLDRIEGAAVGAITAKSEVVTTHAASNQNIGTIIGIVGAVALVLSLAERFIK